IGAGTAIFHGEIEYLGDPIYSERGFVYNINHNPTTDDSKVVVSGTSEGEYSSDVDGLVVGNIYYVRAFATNAQGTAYGEEVEVDFGELKPQVTTGEASNINLAAGTATLNGTIVSVGDPAYTERGFVYAMVHNPTVEENADTKKVVPGTDSGAFSINVSGLVLNTLYYVRAYATNSQGTVYGLEKELDMTGTLPVVTTAAVSGISIESGTATFKGTIEELGDPAYTERGFVYGLTHNPTIDDTKRIVSGNASGVFSANISELVRNKIYYIRAYATNAVGTSYGEEVVLDFTTVMPVVNTSTVTAKNIGAGTATFNGTIVSVGDPSYTERGFVYGLTHSPTIDDTKKVVSGNGTGTFSANVTGLSVNKIYYIRAYATNIEGTVYGTEVSADFSAIMPTVTTSSATSINLTAGTATLNGKIESIGDPAYTERGFVYATIHNPTVEDNSKKVAPGSGTGDFSANISGLVLNTTYYIRAYAKSSQGTAYGSEVTLNFKGTLATVKTNAATNISIASKIATFNGSIENVGNPAYTERGFVYGITHNPNIVDDTKKIAEGSGAGAFSASVTNLEMNKIYYVRAYATNLQGTAYGNEVTLDFSQKLPVVTTQEVTDKTNTTATFNGTIVSIGDPVYTERGFIYGTMPVPAVDDTGAIIISVSGSGTGAYASSVNNLTTGTTYYVRAYAKVGTLIVYGNIVNFVAQLPPYVVLPGGLFVARNDVGDKLTNTSASTMCNNSSLGGFTDWRLPTINELSTVYSNKDLIGNFQEYGYWSSSYAGKYGGVYHYYLVRFTTGNIDYASDSSQIYARCVRTEE
ncbi:DUF1566 domain-containing protein, partial [bacterium]|nr:DUF1566 domain-containing protein [bacterium]